MLMVSTVLSTNLLVSIVDENLLNVLYFNITGTNEF